MGGKIGCKNHLRPNVGVTAFTVNIKAPVGQDTRTSSDGLVGPEQINIGAHISDKTKILIYEDEVFSQIALETILFDDFKLARHVQFFSTGKAI